MSLRLWGWALEEVGLVSELLLQAFCLLVDLSLLPASLLLFSFLLLSLLLEELECLPLFLLFLPTPSFATCFRLSLLLACLGLYLRLQSRSLGFDFPL